jgi:hypothetical protein
MTTPDLSGAQWTKSSRSGGNSQCALVAKVDGFVAMRDSKLGDASPTLIFTAAEWSAFLGGVKDGEFD